MAAFIRTVWKGNFLGVQDWSFGLNFLVIGTGGIGQADLDAWLALVHTDTTTYMAATGGGTSWLSNQGHCTEISAYHQASPTTPADVVSNIAGLSYVGGGNVGMPPQCSIVHSLHSANPRRNGRGRAYVPAFGCAVVAGSGRLGSPTALSMATAMAALINSINGHAVGGNAVGCGSPSTGDIFTQLSVNDQVDTQRRRTDKVGSTTVAVAAL